MSIERGVDIVDIDSCTYFPPPTDTSPVAAVSSNRQRNPQSHELKDWTTLGIGGRAREVVLARTEDEIVDAVRQADEEGTEVLVLGGGSNLVVSSAPFDGIVIHDTRATEKVTHDTGCGGVVVTVTGGFEWDEFVALAVQNGWMGVEALSGIPGTVGAAPVQNIGAYGHEVSSILASIRVWDRLEKRRRTLFLADLELGYRTSVLKRSRQDPSLSEGRVWGPTGRWVILEVEFQMHHASLSAPIQYAELARHLGTEVGQRLDARTVREAVLELRRSKSMVLDDSNRNTYSAGSFFTNPIITQAEAQSLPDEAPRYPVRAVTPVGSAPDPNRIEAGVVKTSAAWLINQAGFERGYRVNPGAAAALSTDHVLALTNRGGATSQDIAELARSVRDGVRDRWGIELTPEPVCVGWSL
ncbi:MAG: UDP-N-acetylmuramate dehydrogenase [Actinomycetaceae bacterium]|nr:UDP-N-acetylmuramate dehydrogenase [Actinomycetaceae bacterium]